MNTLIEIFSRLGDSLDGFGGDSRSAAVVNAAVRDNIWFTRQDILYAVEAVRSRMLDRGELQRWLSSYPGNTGRRSRVVVVMAGNIPLAGFFDLLCVLVTGNECCYKLSGKDRALMDHVITLLRTIEPELPLFEYRGQRVDAAIATGSDNTNRYFRNTFGEIPSIFRGSRYSAAVLTGREARSSLELLAGDIFRHSGLGCRNVSLLWLPTGYEVGELMALLGGYELINPHYMNNYRQSSALLGMAGEPFLDGGFFTMRESDTFPVNISEIAYSFYSDPDDVAQWLDANGHIVQCVVSEAPLRRRTVPFGSAQRPDLGDYPDGRDVISFLGGL